MAEVLPLRAWRYNHRLSDDIGTLTSPLFDVITSKQRDELYDNPLNSIHLSVPQGSEPVENAKSTLLEWRKNKVIVQDQLPGIYVHYQYFSLHGTNHEFVRKGFICNIKIYDWHEKVLLRHEKTMPGSVNDRTEVLHQTQLNVSPTHGLYTDPSHEIEKYLDDAIESPIHEVEDYQGVRDVFSVIHDKNIIDRIIEIIKDKQIILADGHHRYEGSLLYKKRKEQENPHHTGSEKYNYHMMYLTNTESEDLRILPTHRVFSGFDELNENLLLESLSEYFTIKNIPEAADVDDVILGEKWAFGLIYGDNAYQIKLKPEAINKIDWKLPDDVKTLDLTVLHYFIIQEVLKIKQEDQPTTKKVKYERNFTECLKEVIKGEAQFAIITSEISIETVKKVCYSGYTLPQKSTYFYPKIICGFLFSSIDDNETKTRFDISF